MQQLLLGIVERDPGTESILNQIGVNWAKNSLEKSVELQRFAAIIVNRELSARKKENLLAYLKEGGAALSWCENATSIDSTIKTRQQFIRYIEPKGRLFNETGLLWLKQQGFLMEAATEGKINGKHPAVLLKKEGKGLLIALPFNPGKAFLDDSREERGFYSEKSFPSETVSTVSKGNLASLFFNCLAQLFDHREIPLLHKWYYPKRFHSVFGFHVDVDNAVTEDIKKTKQVLAKKALWFVNVEAIEKNPAAFELLQEEKIGSHNYRHRLFKNLSESVENLSIAHRFLKKSGKEPSGFSAPNGFWNKSLAMALERLGYDYAVAFGLGYDCLPFHPLSNGDKAKMLLVGVHPICISILKTRDFNELEMSDYFKQVIERNVAAKKPLFFYGHPLKRIARFPNVVREIFETIAKKEEVWQADVQQFASWWRQREKKQFKAFFEKNRLLIQTANREKDFSVRLLFQGFERILPMESRAIDLKKIAGLRKAKRVVVRDTTTRISPFGKKFLAKKFLARLLEAVFK